MRVLGTLLLFPCIDWTLLRDLKDIDKTLKLGTNVPMGPLTLAVAWLPTALYSLLQLALATTPFFFDI